MDSTCSAVICALPPQASTLDLLNCLACLARRSQVDQRLPRGNAHWTQMKVSLAYLDGQTA